MVESDRNGCNASVDNDVNSVDTMRKYVYDSHWTTWKIKWGGKNKIEIFFLVLWSSYHDPFLEIWLRILVLDDGQTIVNM